MGIEDRLIAVEKVVHGVLVRHSITALRVTVGAVFFGFLKFFPGVSPAQDLAVRTIHALTFGVVPWQVGIVVIASLECFIGICLLANRWMRLAGWLLVAQLVGVLAPIVLLTGRLFSGPHNAPTLEGQYVLKDIILVAAGMAIAAGTFRGGRLTRDEPEASGPLDGSRGELDAGHELQIVLSGGERGRPVRGRDQQAVSQSPTEEREHAGAVFYGAMRTLDEHASGVGATSGQSDR